MKPNSIWALVAGVAAVLCALIPGLLTPIASFAAIPEYDRVRVLEAPRPVPETKLTDQHGQAFSLQQLRSTVVLVFFGFTNCPDVCPAAMGKFRLLQTSEKIETDEVSFVLISVDGDRDTPAVMKEYMANFSPDFIGLTAEPVKVKSLAKAFRASFYKGQVSETNGSYSMMHSPQVFVLDRGGNLRAEMYDPPIETMAGVIEALLSESEE